MAVLNFLNLCNTLLYESLSLDVSCCSLMEWVSFIFNISLRSLLLRFFYTSSNLKLFKTPIKIVRYFLNMLQNCRFFLVFSDFLFLKHLFVCPTYELSHDKQLTLYTALFLKWFLILSLPLTITWDKLLLDFGTQSRTQSIK